MGNYCLTTVISERFIRLKKNIKFIIQTPSKSVFLKSDCPSPNQEVINLVWY